MLHKTIPPIAVLISRCRNACSTVAKLRFFDWLQTGIFLGLFLLLFAGPSSLTIPLIADETIDVASEEESVTPLGKTPEKTPPSLNKANSEQNIKEAPRAAPAYAGALILKRSVAELTTEADRIVVADVQRVQSEYNVDRSNIFTFVTLAVDKVLKGHSNDQTTLSLPGGKVGDDTLLVGGVPNFIAGERVLLFLGDGSEFGIVGMWQGKYSLSGDEAFQPETGQTVSVAVLEQEIGQALNEPVEIGTSPKIVHAQFTTYCRAWSDTAVPVPHYVNPANPGIGAPMGNSFVSAMYDALYSWQSLSNSWITLRVAGTTTRDGTDHDDGNNDIVWADLSSGVLGINYCRYNGIGRFDSDTRFDNSGTPWTMTTESGKYDLRSTAEHELGHGIGIGHSDDDGVTFCNETALTPLMCPYVTTGIRKTILTDDSNAAASLYPLSGFPPDAPSNLSVIASGTSNNLTWTDKADDEHAFEIQRASDSCGGTFKGVATVPANTTNYSDNDYGVGLSGIYCYRLKALNRGGDSGYSNLALNSALDVDKTMVSTDVITASSKVTYTVTLANNDSNPLNDVTVSESLPPNATYVPGSATSSPAITLGDFPTNTTPPFTIGANSTVVITYVLQVTDTAQRGDTLNNTVTVSTPILLESLQSSTSHLIDPINTYLPFIFKN